MAPLVRGASHPWGRAVQSARCCSGRDRERHELDAALAGARLNRSAVARRSPARSGSARRRCSTTRPSGRTRPGCASCARGGSSRRRACRSPGCSSCSVRRSAALDRIPEPQRAALEGALALRPATAQDRFAVGAATLSLLAAHAEDAPVAAFVDDAHWLDGSSADALLFAMRRLVADPIAVVVAVRDERAVVRRRSAPADAAPGRARPRRRPPRSSATTPRSTVSTRRPRATRSRCSSSRRRRRVWPSFRSTRRSPIVGSVARGFVRRAESLPEGTRRALVVAAAERHRRACSRSSARVPGCVEELAPGRGCRPRRAAGRPRRVQPCAGAVGRLRRGAGRGAPRRAPRARRRAARPRRRPPRVASRARRRSARTRPPPPRSSRRARRARERSAYAVAAAAYERAARAVAASPRAPALPRRPTPPGSPARQTGRSRCWTTPSRRRARPRARRSRIEHLRGQIAARRGPVREAQSILAAAAERAAATDPEAAVVMLAEATMPVVLRGRRAGDAADGRARATELAAGARRARGDLRRRSPTGWRSSSPARATDGARSIRRAVAQLEASDELRNDPHLAVWAALGPLWLREAEAGREPVRARARRSSAAGRRSARCPSCSSTWRATGRRRTSWPAAHAGYSEAIALARETGQDVALAFGLGGLAWLEARQGREAECRAHAAEGREACIRAGVAVHELWTLAALGDLELGLGRPEAALGHYQEWDALLAARGIEDTDLSPAPELAETLLRLGRVEDAAAAAAASRAERPRQGPAVGARTRRPHAAACSRPTRSSSGSSTRRSTCTSRRPTSSRPRGRASPTARACAGPAGASAPARSCARRSRRSTRSAPCRGRTSRARSSRRRARPRAGATRRRSTS